MAGDISPQAITAAMASLSKHHDVNLWLTAAEGTAGGLLARKELLTRAVAAAAPQLLKPGTARDVAADAVALSKQHADRADAAEQRCAQLADGIRRLLISGPIGHESGERYIRADLIRAVLDEHDALPREAQP